MTKLERKLERLQQQGFWGSCILREGFLKVRCRQCEATFINGVPCHERGCPETTHECHGCNEIVPANVTYCEDCR